MIPKNVCTVRFTLLKALPYGGYEPLLLAVQCHCNRPTFSVMDTKKNADKLGLANSFTVKSTLNTKSFRTSNSKQVLYQFIPTFTSKNIWHTVQVEFHW